MIKNLQFTWSPNETSDFRGAGWGLFKPVQASLYTLSLPVTKTINWIIVGGACPILYLVVSQHFVVEMNKGAMFHSYLKWPEDTGGYLSSFVDLCFPWISVQVLHPSSVLPFLKKLGDDTPELKHLDFRAFMCLLVAVAGLELDTPQWSEGFQQLLVPYHTHLPSRGLWNSTRGMGKRRHFFEFRPWMDKLMNGEMLLGGIHSVPRVLENHHWHRGTPIFRKPQNSNCYCHVTLPDCVPLLSRTPGQPAPRVLSLGGPQNIPTMIWIIPLNKLIGLDACYLPCYHK